VPPGWWTLFADPELSRLEALAVEANQDLVAAMHRVDAARADFRVTRADLLPSLNSGASTDRSQSSANFTQLPGFTPPEVTQYRLTSGLSYEIDLWGKVRRKTEAARANLAGAAFERDAVMLRLTGEVGEQYFNLRTLDAEVTVLAATIEAREASLEIARSRHAGGIAGESDVTRAQSALAAAQADAVDVARRRELSGHTLAQLCGQPAGAFQISATRQIASEVPRVPLTAPASLLRQRPDIAQSERTVAARTAEIGVAIGERLPSVTLNGSLNLESLSLSDLLSSGSRAFSIGPEVSLPVFSGGANAARVEKAEARRAEALADYRGVVLTAVKEVEDALANARGYEQLAARQRENVAAAARTTALALKRYSEGLVNYLEVVDSQREELLARRSLIEAQGNRLISAVQLMKALGGGWGTAVSPVSAPE
jgi:multidrug efflux system outer membrane protein